MMKYSFFNDYSEGAHPSILELMIQTNQEQEAGYGLDQICEQAGQIILDQIKNPQAQVHFVSGGTQANLLVLAAMMKPYEAVIASNQGHIHVHETGAVEASGHKIEIIESRDGKLTAAQIQAVLDGRQDEHMVKPKVVFISHSTEVGTIYLKQELESIAQLCRQNDLYLYLDGARLGSGLCSRESNFTLPELSELVDAFYIGGTKNGALLGEAIVINNPGLQPYFRYHMKQRGALLAKGRIIGAQFLGLFRDNLYFELARHANAMAERLTSGLKAQGIPFLTHSTTNQIFPIFTNTANQKLHQEYGFYDWCAVDDGHTAVRFVTSWATPQEKVDQLLDDVMAL
jgi:threonine aldolase